MKFQLIYCFWFLLFAPISDSLNCIPERCRFEDVYQSPINDIQEKGYWKRCSLFCEFDQNNNAFQFNTTLAKCDVQHNNITDILFRCTQIGRTLEEIVFRWTKTSSNDLAILDKRFQFSNVKLFFNYWRISRLDFLFWNMDGFDLNILDELTKNRIASSIEISNSRFDFYHDKTKIESCEDIINSNLTQMRSIFQLATISLTLRNMHYKNSVCPLVFQNSHFGLFLYDFVDTFYKRNILKFHNNTYPNLNKDLKSLGIYNVLNINLDLNILHPSVFNNTELININSRSLNSISGEILKKLKNLNTIMINRIIFKKINHKQGIEWLRQFNYGINENLSNITNGTRTLEIDLTSKTEPLYRGFVDTPISRSLPDEDFCLYANFPFNQLVIVYESDSVDFNDTHSCTYSWLIQYYVYYYKYFIDSNRESYSLIVLLNTPTFIKHINESIATCDFEKRLSNCNKSNYHRKDIWDENDFLILNKKIQIAFKIALYPISLLGLITNFIVVLVILRKKNSDLFKEFKQYNYLYLNSVYCMIITVIELLSWMTECFYPFEVFCPEIRKLVAIQLFKIIFQECFVTMLRFMCNFTYIAFSLNRISLIGKDHGKLVTFMSEIGIKKYIGITFLISCSFSWIKGFKYQVNYFYPYLNYPMSNELDIIQASIFSHRFVDFYFIFNSLTDLVNYLVFVVISIVVDICMVVQLRRTLEEKLIKSASMNLKNENKKAENEEAVNKAIKMVVVNSSIGIFFKLPVFFIPLLNISAQFHFKDLKYYQSHTSFSRFYLNLLDTGFYFLIQDMSKIFFTFSLAIQIFIYKRFDKKFNLGYERLKDQFFAYLRKRFSSSTESA